MSDISKVLIERHKTFVNFVKYSELNESQQVHLGASTKNRRRESDFKTIDDQIFHL